METSVPNFSCEVLCINEPIRDTVIHKLPSRRSHILIAEGVPAALFFQYLPLLLCLVPYTTDTIPGFT